MFPRVILPIAIFSPLLLSVYGAETDDPRTRTRTSAKPNVLFLAVDDLKDWVHCLGGYEGVVHTPNIDRLAKRGMLFANAHCASPKCAPSRAAILTGLRPSTTGLYDNSHWWLPNLPNVVSLPAYFRQHGYHVAGAGKIFHHTAGNNPPNQWDDFFRLTFRDDPWFRGSKLNYPWSKSGPNPLGFPFSGVLGLGHENDWGSLDLPEEQHDDTLSAEYAVRFLEQPQDKPFFLACGFFRPHLPWYVPQRYFDLYPLDQVVLPKVRPDDLDDLPQAGLAFARARRGDWEAIMKSGKWKHAVRAYLASISYADAQLGRVLDALDRGPDASQTVIALWSDHGWHLGEKQHWHKTTLWEEATRVPLVISVPGLPVGICERPVSLLALYPTLAELCGIPLQPPIAGHGAGEPNDATGPRKRPGGIDGTSLVRLLRDPKAAWNRPAIVQFKRGNAAVRSDRFRYIRYHDGGEELYDHATDPYEWNNLSGNPSLQGIKEDLAAWIPQEWSRSAPSKQAFHFDPEQFIWIDKDTGARISGKDE